MKPWTRALLLVAALVSPACRLGSTLDTRTFELRYLDPGVAEGMILPYVYVDRPKARGQVTHVGNTITVRETPDNLAKIARVLTEFDRPTPTVQLHFQILSADGAGPSDPAIAPVEAQLRKLFRFRGYRLLGETVVSAAARSHITQTIGGAGGPYVINGQLHSVRAAGDSGTVQIEVELTSRISLVLRTALDVALGQTVVLGSGAPGAGSGALILTLRPELVRSR